MNFKFRSQEMSISGINKFRRFFLRTCRLMLFPLLAVIVSTLLAGLLAPVAPAHADGYPPYWDNSNAAVHFAPVAWPADSAWIPYTYGGVGIKDQRTQDPSNGGTSPQNYVNVSSQCTDQSLPSIAWYFNSDKNVLFFRWRVEQIANTYATGPSAGPYGATDPWKSAQWTVMIDIDGDGFREFAFHLNGSSGSPSTAVDVVKSIYSNTSSQSIDYENNPAIFELFHNPAAFVYKTYGVGDPYLAYDGNILNFRNSFDPVPIWPNGSAETAWDYGTTRSTNITTPTCNEYYIDYQIPLAMLDASSVGGPTVTATTPISLSFVTANSLQNPLQKDAVFDGIYTGTPESCLPFGDTMSLGGGYMPQPVVDWVMAAGCNTTNLSAQVRDAVNASCQDTLTSVDFYYWYDKNANGLADDAGSSWTFIGSGAVNPVTPSRWTYSGWNTTGLDRGQYLIGVQAKDNAISGNSNLTFSYLTTAQLPANAPGETNYANPAPTPGVVQDIFNNTCGSYVSLTKSVSPAYAPAGSNVTFTITVQNSTSSPFNLTSITDALPSGFSYQSAPAEGGALAASIATRPANNATGNVTWTFAGGTSIPAASSRTLTFTAKVSSTAGTYTNSASAVTDDPDWGSLNSNTVDIGVGAPQLTIAKRPSVYSAVPGDTVTYTITYSNDSPVNTTGVVLTDTLPAGLSFVAAGSGGIYDSAARTITWNLGSLASGEGPYTVSYQVTVELGAAVRTINTATIDSAETSPATATTSIYVPTPLQITKTANKVLVDPRGVSPANQVVYTIAYRNTGTSTLNGATITDTTMPGFTYASCSGGGGCTAVEPSGDGYGDDDSTCEAGEPCSVTWASIGSIAAGASGSVNLTLTVVDPYTQANPAINTAVIDTNETGPFEDSASVAVREYDCGVTKERYFFHDLDASGYPFPWTGVFPGTPLPATLARDYANKTAPVSPTATDITVNITNDNELELAHFYMDPPLSQTSGFSIAGTVDMQAFMSKGSGGKVNIIAYLYDYDPDTGETVQIGTQAADSGAGIRDNYLLAFSVTPTGIIRAGNLILWRFTTQRNSTYTGDVSFHFDSTATTGTQAGLSYGDVCFAPLSITMNKTVDKLEAAAGDTLAYTITFTNSGQQSVLGATITDILPTGVTFTSATMNGTAMTSNCPTPGLNQYCASGQTYTFEAHTAGAAAGVLAGGGTGTLVINVTINSPLVGITTLTNLARLSTASTDPVEDTATTDITHTPTPDVLLQKSADKTLLNPGDTVTYTITAVNVGDANATAINVSDTIPAETYFTYVSGSIAGGDSRSAAGAPTLTWTINTLTPGSTVTLTFQMLVASSGVPAGVTDKNNFASATEATTTPPNSNTVRVSITTNANLAITNTVSSPVYSDNVGTGNGATKIFNATLSSLPVQAGSLEVYVAGVLVGVDSGTGTIIGGGLAASTIDYATGAIHLEFLTAPANGAAITVTYLVEIAPGTVVQYTIVVTSNGGSTATSVSVSDYIPAGTSYVPGSLIYDGAAQTDQSGDDSAYYDGTANRVVFTPGDMAVDTFHTLKFSVVMDGTFADGSTTVIDTATAQATNTASKSDTATVVVTTEPDLAVSKAAPSLVPYPLATLNGNHTATTTLTLTNPPGSRYFAVGDRIYINGLLRVVTSITSATQIVVDQTVTAGGGTQVLPVIKYTLYYANNGTASAPDVTIKDILPAGLFYLSATPAPTLAPAYDTNGILKWDFGTLAPGDGGTIVVYTRPTATGSYSNTATMGGSTVPSFPSNTVVTAAGALELAKSTSSPSVVNNPADGADYATYVITVRNPFAATTANGISVTDYLPQGFTYFNTVSIGCPAGCARSATVNPTVGTATPTWGTWSLGSGVTLTITFRALLASTVNAATYQNGVTATSTNVSVLPFDELNTTAEDVTVTIPADLGVAKRVTLTPGCGIQVGCNVTFDITVTNFGTSNAYTFTVNDLLPGSVTYVPPYTATEGAWDGTNWTFAGGVAAPITTTSSVVLGTDGKSYTCIKRHTATAADRPITGANWQTYWVLGGSNPVAWTNGAVYTSATAKLTITATINSIASTITNTATITASTFAGGAADSNASNNASSISLVPTVIVLSRFDAHEENGQVVVEWETSSEVNTLGFFLSRLDESSGKYHKLNSRLLPALLSPPRGGSYRLIDAAALPGRTYSYLLTEVEINGATKTYGPFTLAIAAGKQGGSFRSVKQPGSSVMDISGISGRDSFRNYSRKAPEMSDDKKLRLSIAKELRALVPGLKTKRQGSMLKIPIEKDGLYYLDASEISRLMGIDLSRVQNSIREGNFALSSQGNNVAYLPAENNAGIFFYGLHTDSIYTKENIYWLSRDRGIMMEYLHDEGPAPAGTMSFTETVHAEENRLIGAYPFIDPEADFWFWEQIFSGYSPYDTKTFTIEAKGAAETAATATLTVNLQGISETEVNPDHHIEVSVNGTVIGEDSWNGTEKKTASFDFSQALLNSGPNTIQVKGLLDTGAPWSYFYINSFDLTYQRLSEAQDNALLLKAGSNPIVTVQGFNAPDIYVFDVTDPLRPGLKTSPAIDYSGDNYSASFVPSSPGSVYLAITAGAAVNITNAWADTPSRLRGGNHQVDYILIAPDELIAGARQLSDYRKKKGLKTMIVNVENIMDEFNYGLSSPKAIQAFLAYAHNNWSRPPKYALLIGDGTYDYRDNLQYGENLVPTMVVATPLGLFSSDNILADVNADHVPDIAIGRLAVVTPEELRDVTDKIIAYERNAYRGILMLADNADDGGNFPVDSEEFTTRIPSRYPVNRIYLSEYQINDARQLLFDTINSGTGIINYFGHASSDNLAAENLMGINDVAALSSGSRTFLLNAMTCMIGQYAFPGLDSLSETLMLKKDGGAAAVWAPSGMAFHFDSRLLDEFFFNTALAQKGATLGRSTLNAYRSFYERGGPAYVLDIYNLQGDPAMRLR